MSISGYLKDKAAGLAILIIAVALLAFLLWAYQVDTAIIVAACALVLGSFCIALASDYLKRRRFYDDLEKLLSNKEAGEAYYLSELIEPPGFLEASLLYESLKQGNKDMNDRIAEYKLGSEEYQEYVETWIHEVKTPLAAARLIIANRNDTSLRSLEHELDRTEAYIEQALYYARSTAVEKDYVLKTVNLDELVKNAVKKHSHLLIEQGITPRFENLDKQVFADSKWLDFILGQVIANSARYARKPSPELVFTAEHSDEGFDGGKVTLSIRDNGIGIPPQDVKRVFEKGFTGENGRLYAKSTGIGLYLCKKLCEGMKLSIRLSSTVGEGTTVTIEFPLNKMYFLS